MARPGQLSTLLASLDCPRSAQTIRHRFGRFRDLFPKIVLGSVSIAGIASNWAR